MPRGNGTGPQGLGAGTGRRKARSESGLNSPFQKSTLGGTLFAFASMLIGNWLDKKLSQKKSKDKSKQVESRKNKKNPMP
ncbi:DUF5320 domain-containing protein [Acidobacteriota bacterium]